MSDDATLELISLNVFHGSQNKIQAKMAYKAWNYAALASCHLSSSQSSVHPPLCSSLLHFSRVSQRARFLLIQACHVHCPFTSQLNITILERPSAIRFPDFLSWHRPQSIHLYGFLTAMAFWR